MPTTSSNKLMAMIALCLGYFMVIIDVTIVNVALPTIAKNLHGGISWLQWVVDGYTLTFACLLLSAGNLGDRVGAKPAFCWGLFLFALTSLGCGLATSFPLLVFFRLLQGASAALLVPTSIKLINAAFEDKKERAKAIGIWASIGGIAAASGPVLGALLTSWLGWRAVFFVNIPIGILGFLLTLKFVANPKSNHNGGFDFPGQVAGIMMIAALAFGLIEAGRLGWYSHLVLGSFVIFIFMLMLFLWIENRSHTPMLSLTLFHSKNFSTCIFLGVILNLGFYGLFFILPLYFQQLRGYSVLLTGLAILPQVVLAAPSSYIGGRITSHFGPRLPMLIGFLAMTIGLFCTLIAGEHTPPYYILILPLLMISFGGAFSMPALTVATIHAVPENRVGIASGALNSSRQIGSLIGVAIFGTIINTSKNFITGMHYALIIGGVTYLCGYLLILGLLPRE